MNDSSDNQLVALALYGDAKAFELIVRRYQKLVYNVLFNMLRDHSATADATQDTFLKAYKALPTFRTELAFKPWLLRIATNTGLNAIRDEKQKASDSLDEMLEIDPLNEPVSWASADLEAERNFVVASISGALTALPARQRHIFVLRYQHDLSYADISNIVNETEGVVKTQLFRAREKLRKLLYDQLKVEGGA